MELHTVVTHIKAHALMSEFLRYLPDFAGRFVSRIGACAWVASVPVGAMYNYANSAIPHCTLKTKVIMVFLLCLCVADGIAFTQVHSTLSIHSFFQLWQTCRESTFQLSVAGCDFTNLQCLAGLCGLLGSTVVLVVVEIRPQVQWRQEPVRSTYSIPQHLHHFQGVQGMCKSGHQICTLGPIAQWCTLRPCEK